MITLALRGVCLCYFFLYSLIDVPFFSAISLFGWLLTIATAGLLAKHMNRSMAAWTLGAIVVPYWAPALLALSHRRPANALTAIDNSWLNMERPTNKMVVCGVLFFDESLEPGSLKETLTNGLLQFDRFRQRVIEISRFNCWVDDKEFDLDNHLNFHKLPEGSDMESFHDRVNHLTEQPLEMTRPLWQMDVFEGLNGGSALVIRIHHCIADGIALVRVLLSMTQPLSHGEMPSQENPVKQKEHQNDSAFTQMVHLIGGLLAAFPHALKLPDSDSRLKNRLTGERKTAWSAPFDLERVRLLSKAHQGKINDLVLAATAGALREYLKEHGSNPDDMVLRVLVPINLKPIDGDIILGNQVGFVYLPLPIREKTPLDRLQTVKQEMDTIKGGQEALLSLIFLKLIGTLPKQLQSIIIDTFNKNASSTMTNVPGPREPLLFAKSELKNMMFFGPQSGTMGVGISVLSYAGKMTMGLNADKNLIPDPERLVELFLKELEDWPEP
ncbi:MAG: wax ester/triacylglycerol synthase family O-acyltransferase [Pseudomonadales bacterium]|nr:wax ester/triacylglycerol synthase family O-acyltransferase [Pseudomonadales bacterium]